MSNSTTEAHLAAAKQWFDDNVADFIDDEEAEAFASHICEISAIPMIWEWSGVYNMDIIFKVIDEKEERGLAHHR